MNVAVIDDPFDVEIIDNPLNVVVINDPIDLSLDSCLHVHQHYGSFNTKEEKNVKINHHNFKLQFSSYCCQHHLCHDHRLHIYFSSGTFLPFLLYNLSLFILDIACIILFIFLSFLFLLLLLLIKERVDVCGYCYFVVYSK